MNGSDNMPLTWKIWCKDIREQRISGPDTGDDGIMVIEYSAFEKAEEQIVELVEALSIAKFDLEMTRDIGGFNHQAIPNIEIALAKFRKKDG